MGFNGIILADDLSMAAVGAPPEIAIVEAVIAGVDMFFAWPNDLPQLYGAILKAIESGALSKERVRAAAERVIYQKIRYGIIK
jgi:beta-glucosidase-like glycosyl hydrolase